MYDDSYIIPILRITKVKQQLKGGGCWSSFKEKQWIGTCWHSHSFYNLYGESWYLTERFMLTFSVIWGAATIGPILPCYPPYGTDLFFPHQQSVFHIADTHCLRWFRKCFVSNLVYMRYWAKHWRWITHVLEELTVKQTDKQGFHYSMTTVEIEMGRHVWWGCWNPEYSSV